jgi:hypothetical protein
MGVAGEDQILARWPWSQLRETRLLQSPQSRLAFSHLVRRSGVTALETPLRTRLAMCWPTRGDGGKVLGFGLNCSVSG